MNVKRDFNKPGDLQPFARLVLSPDLADFNPLQKLIYKKLGGKKVTIPLLRIEGEWPANLKADKDKLFYFEVGEQRHFSKLENFEMESQGHAIPIGIDLSQIKDVQQPLDSFAFCKKFPVTCKVFCENNQIDKWQLELEIVPFFCEKPDLREANNLVHGNKAVEVAIEHKISNSKARLFELVFINPAKLMFTNPIPSSRLRLRVEDEGRVVTEGFYLAGDFGQGMVYNLAMLAVGKLYPVYVVMDFEKYNNPAVDKVLQIYIDQEFREANGKNVWKNIFQGKVTVRPDSERTELGAAARLVGDKNLLLNLRQKPAQNLKIETPINWAIGASVNIELLAFALFNKARNPQPFGQVEIENFSLDFRLQDEKGQMQSRKEWLKDYKEQPPSFRLPNGGTPFRLACRLPVSHIYKALPDITPGEIQIQFSYKEVQEQSKINTGPHEVNLTVQFTLRRYVEKWLALDFGTSAIAAALYDPNLEDRRNKMVLLNLNKIHLQNYTGKNPEFDEQNTEFLYSLMYLDVAENGNEGNGNQIIALTPAMVNFSPPAEVKIKRGFISKVLPNIKLLLGYDNVPLANSAYIKIGSQVKERELPVEEVLRAAYQRLFADYIIPAITELYAPKVGQLSALELLKTFGNIVITVPNMFNQTHEHIITALIEKHLTWDRIPEQYKTAELKNRKSSLFFKNHIKFISESDAVACYYLGNWARFNADKPGNPKEEYILIYDIGAGTVDISYQRVVANAQNELTIEALGKIGAIKAGNTIDTLLAKIIAIEAQQRDIEFKKDVFSREVKNLGDLVYLKDFIKNELKVGLSNAWNSPNNNASLKYNKTLLNRADVWEAKDFDKVVSLELFKENVLLDAYLDSITKNLLSNLVQIVDKKHFRDAKLKVDKVVLSGRAALFKPIQERLQKILADFTTISSAPDILTVPDDELKEAVVLGALQAVTTYKNSHRETRDINAYYGIIWQEKAFGADLYSFRKLLNPGSRPDKNSEDSAAYDSFEELYAIDGGKINMQYADKVMLVKSFAPAPEQDYNKGRTELVTKILEIKKSAVSLKDETRVPIQLKYDDDLMLRLRAQNIETDPASINAFSLEQNLTYEENTWPFNQMVHLSKEQQRLVSEIKSGKLEWKLKKDSEAILRNSEGDKIDESFFYQEESMPGEAITTEEQALPDSLEISAEPREQKSTTEDAKKKPKGKRKNHASERLT